MNFLSYIQYIKEIIKYGYLDNDKTFKKIYTNKTWGYNKSFKYYSGTGSHKKTIIKPYIEIIKIFLKEKKISSVIDFGCGDFNVGKNFVNNVKKYYAYDIFDDLIRYNKKKFIYKNLIFKKKDLTKDNIPKVDLILVRQVLQHLSNKDIKNFIDNIKNKAKYLIITEHLPNNKFFVPNYDKPKGEGLRYNSGVILHEPPFKLNFKNIKQLLSINAKPDSGKILTTLYQLK